MYLDDVQIRLSILYTLKCFKISMTEGNLQEALVWNDILDYFTMMDYLLDMQKLGLVSTVTIEGRLRYDITKKGHETLQMFRDKFRGVSGTKFTSLPKSTLLFWKEGEKLSPTYSRLMKKSFWQNAEFMNLVCRLWS